MIKGGILSKALQTDCSKRSEFWPETTSKK